MFYATFVPGCGDTVIHYSTCLLDHGVVVCSSNNGITSVATLLCSSSPVTIAVFQSFTQGGSTERQHSPPYAVRLPAHLPQVSIMDRNMYKVVPPASRSSSSRSLAILVWRARGFGCSSIFRRSGTQGKFIHSTLAPLEGARCLIASYRRSHGTPLVSRSSSCIFADVDIAERC